MELGRGSSSGKVERILITLFPSAATRSVSRSLRLLAVAGLLVLLWPAGRAWGSADQEAMFQDNQLLLAGPGHLDQTLRTLSSLGVQRLRITVTWDALAPDANSSQMPTGFDGANPADYPQAAWTPFDAIVQAAARYGFGVDFNVTGGAPLWAVPRGAPPGRRRAPWLSPRRHTRGTGRRQPRR